MELLIVEQNGWSKPVKVERAITRIGSDPLNDIQLQSANIAAVHLQVLYSSDVPSSCKVVNLAGEITARISRDTCQLAKYAVVDICNGDEILLGNYWITFRLPLSADVIQSASKIDAALSFADAVLRPEVATIGVLTIKNAGQQPACQFQVELNGLPSDCYQIDPIPLMYPGAQEEVRIRLFHRALYPPAGLQQVILKISAPESYPSEELIIRHGVYVTAVFKQALELIDDLSATVKPQELVEAARPAPEPVTLIQKSPAVNMAVPMVQPEFALPAVSALQAAAFSAPVPAEVVANASAPFQQELPERPARQKPSAIDQKPKTTPVIFQPAPDISSLKVVRGRADADNFWDEK